ncbi:hypothetical protein C0991_006073 [Blastosporella zonata]|nr:hypothetical protein C0991_006073 [Blastosporella zonata]
MALSDDTRELISRVLESLPVLAAKDIPDDEDSYGESGVTKLVACNHIFCRKDLTQWIQSMHGNCPTCRHIFLDIRPPSDSDDESSDGGEYIPGDEDFIDDEDDAFMDTDGFSDAFDYTTDDMADALDWGEEDNRDTDMEDVELDEVDHESEWGLTDGESSMASEDVDTSFKHDHSLEDRDSHASGAAQVGVTLAGQESSDNLLSESGQEK